MSYKIQRKMSSTQIGVTKENFTEQVESRPLMRKKGLCKSMTRVSGIFCGIVETSTQERICIRKAGWLIVVEVHYKGPKKLNGV